MGNQGTSSAFYASRPDLKVDGREVANLEEGLLSLLIEEDTAGLFRCEATFGNWGANGGGGGDEVGFLYFDRELFDFGKEIEILLGDGDARAPIFTGRITGLEGRFPRQTPPELLVLAEDRCQDLRMVRRSRLFEDVSDHDIFEQIAREHGLTPQIDLDGPTYRSLAQLNQSDLAFLRERARSIDAEVWVEGTSLFAQARRRRSAGEVELTWGEGLRELVVGADIAHQRTRVAVTGWDVGGKEALEAEVGEEAIAPELDGGTSGSRTLETAFGDRPDRIVHTVPQSRGEAQAVAEAHFRAAARRFLCGEAVAEGDARIKVATRVDLRGLGPLYDGGYYVAAARHTFDPKNGYLTTFRVERAGLGGAA